MSDHIRTIKNKTFNLKQRKKSILWAKEVLSKNSLFLDTETTGLDTDARIIEIAIIDVHGKFLINTLINPMIKIPADTTKIHGITDDMVKDYPTMLDVMPDIIKVLRGENCIIYNVNYDVPLLENAGFDSNICTFDCAMHRYAQFYGEWNDKYKSFKWQSLTNALIQCNITSNSPLHRALADCEATRQIVQYMATI